MPSISEDAGPCDAVVLFCERAREARPDLTLAQLQSQAVTRICRRLDGIPLALELAAARLRTLSLDHIAEHLGDCFQALGVGARTAAQRQRTLRAALDWSYDLLSGPEQAALRQLAVFPSSFRLDAAIAVVAGDSTVQASSAAPGGLELISQLVDKSLVVAVTSGSVLRYRLLEPVRQYAAEKLAEADETGAARRRHREHFWLRATREVARVDRVYQGLAVLAEFDNYRAALRWSWEERDLDASLVLVGLHMGWIVHNGDIRSRQWLETVLAEPGSASHPARAQALVALAVAVHDLGRPDPERSARLIREATAIARRVADPLLMAWIQFYGADLELAWGHSGAARSLLDAAKRTFEHVAPPVTIGWCHEHLGWVAVLDDDLDDARTHFERAAQLASSDDVGAILAASALAALAPLTAVLNDPERALALADEALRAARRFEVPSVQVMALSRATETALLAGSYGRATAFLLELLSLLRGQTTRAWVADALEMAALILAAEREPDAANSVLEAADALRNAAGERPGGTRALTLTVQQLRHQLADRPAPHPRKTGDHPPASSPDDAIERALTCLGALNTPTL